MFFGLTNSPATFQTMMDAIFRKEICEGWLTIYMDDILVHTNGTLGDHREKVHHVLDCLEKHDLFLKPEKCQFERTKVEFLGVVLEHGTVQMDPGKVEAVRAKPPPRNL